MQNLKMWLQQIWINHKKLSIGTILAAIFFLINLILFILFASQTPPSVATSQPTSTPIQSEPTPTIALPLMRRYENKLFQISYPDTWQEVDIALLNKKSFLFAQSLPILNNIQAARLNVQLLDGSESGEDELSENLERGFTKQNCTFTLPNCQFVERQFMYQNTLLYNGIVIFNKDTNFYLLTFQYPADANQAKNKVLFVEMINSLRIQ